MKMLKADLQLHDSKVKERKKNKVSGGKVKKSKKCKDLNGKEYEKNIKNATNNGCNRGANGYFMRYEGTNNKSIPMENKESKSPVIEKRPKDTSKKPISNKGRSNQKNRNHFHNSFKAEELQPKMIKKGLVVLGCVTEITETFCVINVFDTYTAKLIYEKDHDERSFNLGQFIPVTIKEHKDGIVATSNPNDINKSIQPAEGAIYWGKVTTKTNKFCKIDIGLAVLAKLPLSTVDENGLDVGQRLYVQCAQVEDTKIKVKIGNALSSCGALSANNLIPGTTLKFTVDKPCGAWLRGHILENTVAYIHKKYLTTFLNKYKAGEIFDAGVLFVDPTNRLVYLTKKSLETKAPKVFQETRLKGKLTRKFENGIGVQFHGQNGLLKDYLPNFYSKLGKVSDIELGDYLYFENVFSCKLVEDESKPKRKKEAEAKETKRPKLEEVEEDEESGVEEDESEDDVEGERIDLNSSSESEDEDERNAPILPGMSALLDPSAVETEPAVELSSDDEDREETDGKKKKVSKSKKFKAAREEEARLREIETELADSTKLPQSAEQFDRVLLGCPDNSEMWIRYIAFHMQSTEFEKARAVAKRAIEKISYNESQEKLNVWIAYMNLENMYGTNESFEKVFNEAVKFNDDLVVHLEAIKMLADMQKYENMEQKIRRAKGKFKQDIKMWLEIGKVYYQCKRFADARALKNAALLTVMNKKTHMNLIVQFALMEFNLGEPDQGQALFETILQADPKRVDVWSTYVDQLIKNDDIEGARSVLKRAVAQKLRYKCMKSLFKRFYNFEKKHGTEDSVEHVKKLLEEYTEK